MADTLRKLRIFVASPSDVANERAKVETVVASLKPMADYLGLTLEVVDWRAVVPEAGRPQQVIFDQLKPTSWDIFIGILWHRFGTPPGAKDKTGKDYLSGTEEEFKIAYELWKHYGKPRMVLYRCIRVLPYDVDPDQLKRAREFFKYVEDATGDYPTLYQAFDTTESFEKLLLDNLQRLLIEYGEQLKMPITSQVAQILAPGVPSRVSIPRRAAFFGRTKELDIVMRALSPADRTWGVLVDGIGGIGKTALAIEAAHRAVNIGAFDASVFVTAKQNFLAPSGIREQVPAARTIDEFLNETARVLWQPSIARLVGEEKRRVLLDVLRSVRTLLVYDNLETLTKEEQEAMADFLRELPQGSKAIITSRRRGGEGAVWLRVEKLDWDAARGIIENEMTRDARLANKLRRVELRWRELYDETNGSPLALVHTLGLLRIRGALTFDGALALLRGNRDADLQKFIFQEARKDLTTNDKTALCALSFFTPSATFEAWGQVGNLSRNALEKTIDRLSALSLVDVLGGEERYALHPLTRSFVRDELLSEGDLNYEMGMRFSEYWLSYAKRYGSRGEVNKRKYELIDREWENLKAAWGWLWQIAKVTKNNVEDENAFLTLSDLVATLFGFVLASGRLDNLPSNSQENAKFMFEIWRSVDTLVERLVDQQRTDPTWGHQISSAAFACEALGVLGKTSEARATMEFLRNLYSVNSGHLELDVSNLSTVDDFMQIRLRMLTEDKQHSARRYKLEDPEYLDLRLFHENWASGLLLCAEKAVGYTDQASLTKLAQAVEVRLDKRGYFYPSRVPWCTARVLIGLGRCGRNIRNSKAVQRAADWLMKSRAEGGAREDVFWVSGTGTWNSSVEATVMSINALREVGIPASNPVLQNAMTWVFQQRKHWTEIGYELDGAIAIEAYLRMGGNWQDVADEITYLSHWGVGQAVWRYSTESASKTQDQSGRAVQIGLFMTKAIWLAIRTDLPSFLDLLDSYSSNLKIQPLGTM